MPNKQVAELTDIDAVAGTDSIPIRDASDATELKEATMAQVATFIDAAGAAASAVSTHASLTTSHGVAGDLVGTTDAQTLTNKSLNSFTNTIDADRVHVQVRNATGSTISAGAPVYVSGYNVGTGIVEVALADASSSATMPAIGLLESDIANNASGDLVALGVVTGIDTSAWSVGDELYVSETAGALTSTPPTGSARVQAIATVVRSNVSTGVLQVQYTRTVGTLATQANTSVNIDGGSVTGLSELGVAGDITVTGTVDGRDVATDGSKLDGIEASADVTDTANVAAAGAVMETSVPVTIGIAASDEVTELTTGTGKATFRMPHAMTLTAVRASLTTASSSGVVTVDINEAGTTILSTKLTIDATEKTSATAAVAAVISDSALADDAEITVDIDGAGTGAAGLKVWLIGTRDVS